LGLIGFPATPIPLAILFLRYPAGNRPLFYALIAYAVVVGLAMVSLKYVPDVPFFAMGVTALLLVLCIRSRQTQPLTSKGH
jgi:multisubunit Na+/H+ antiporter MnhC subunit